MSYELNFKVNVADNYLPLFQDLILDSRTLDSDIPLESLKGVKVVNLFCGPQHYGEGSQLSGQYPVYGLLKANKPIRFEQVICLGLLPNEVINHIPINNVFHVWKLSPKKLWISSKGVVKTTIDIHIPEKYIELWQDAQRNQQPSRN
ncbi:hypothetical protein [Pleionea sp. CnH1-48]|uniref:hypothetical protein n=1 Tax=Pleionea sp. CnH1-48 TaxID=2954494 RepID=UPI0020973A5D|nr:hypothetical protein [Pleionea sp. CnH1-48]MCO7227529.1 hypothetical protein [Pleionea sp. CnH1-48]